MHNIVYIYVFARNVMKLNNIWDMCPKALKRLESQVKIWKIRDLFSTYSHSFAEQECESL